MSDKKIIAVVGATGNQGSSAVKTFTSLPDWSVRALTRNTTSTKAQELATLGAELFQVDLEDAESLKPAFAGVHAVFCVTTFWDVYLSLVQSGTDGHEASIKGYEAEIRHCQNVANAAAQEPTLEKFVISSLGPLKEASKGKYSEAYHWESKSASVKWIKNNVPAVASKMSVFYPGCYATNQFLYPKKNAQGEYELIMSTSENSMRMPIIDERVASGAFVRCLVEDEPAGINLLGYNSNLTINEFLSAWEGVTGKKAKFTRMPVAEIAKLTGLPLEILEAPDYIEEFGYMAGVENPKEPKDLKNPPKLSSYEEYLAAQEESFLLER